MSGKTERSTSEFMRSANQEIDSTMHNRTAWLLHKRTARIRQFHLALLAVLFCQIQAADVNSQDKFVVPDERLQKLDPNKPEGYRDLAEEMSAVRNSPLARDLTTRLYLICAASGEGKVRRSALRGLIRTARNKGESQKFKALAYLQDDQFSSLLYATGETQPQNEGNQPNKKRDAIDDKVLDALKSLRQGKMRRARKIMEDQAVRSRFGKFEKLVPLDEFLKAIESSEVSDSLLLRIIQMDSMVKNGADPESAKASGSDVVWRYIFKNRIPPRLPKIDFDTVTEFDPKKSIYRNGMWRTPSKN